VKSSARRRRQFSESRQVNQYQVTRRRSHCARHGVVDIDLYQHADHPWYDSDGVTLVETVRRSGPWVVEASLGIATFFRRSDHTRLRFVASTARGVADELELLLEGVAPLQTANPNEVSFLDNRRYASALDQISPGAVIVNPDMAARVLAGTVAAGQLQQDRHLADLNKSANAHFRHFGPQSPD